MTTTPTARAVTGMMQRYAKDFSAGAFAMPIASEFDSKPSAFKRYDDDTVVAYSRQLATNAHRTDWTGRRFTIPGGARFASHVARANRRADVPQRLLLDHDYLRTYIEDLPLTEALYEDRRRVIATQITAASELLAIWGPPGTPAHKELPWDRPTVKAVPMPRGFGMWVEEILTEMERVDTWVDDYPFYSDGSWGAVSLRGFWPEDPSRGVKPSEMSRAWKHENQADLDRQCDWTVLGDKMPATRKLVERFGFAGLERVRLLRMAGTGKGKLGRHTDITDKASGTKDGQIVRFHIPLRTHPHIKLHTWDLDGLHAETFLPEWGCFYLDARKPHAVTNPTEVNRVHLVIDALADQHVRDMLAGE